MVDWGRCFGYGRPVENGELCFSERAAGTVSVFAPGGEACGVTLSGLKYPLTNYTLTSDMPLGVSNEFTGAPSESASGKEV